MFKLPLYAFSLALLSCAQQEILNALADTHNSSTPRSTCDQIALAISRASQVFFPRERDILSSGLRHSNLINNQVTPEYVLDLSHASASSSQSSVCSVEPGSTDDVSKIVS